MSTNATAKPNNFLSGWRVLFASTSPEISPNCHRRRHKNSLFAPRLFRNFTLAQSCQWPSLAFECHSHVSKSTVERYIYNCILYGMIPSPILPHFSTPVTHFQLDSNSEITQNVMSSFSRNSLEVYGMQGDWPQNQVVRFWIFKGYCISLKIPGSTSFWTRMGDYIKSVLFAR